jgi:hypothetical protein
MAYSNVDRAVTIPNLVAPEVDHQMDRLYQRGEQRRLQEQAYAQRQLQRQGALSKLVGDSFQDKNYMNGTVTDPIIVGKLAGYKDKYLKQLKGNPNIDENELRLNMAKDMSEISALSANIKTVAANVNAQTKAYSGMKGVDANAIKQIAMNNFMYNIDPKTGAKTMKPLNEMDPNKDYIQEAMEQNPELISHGDEGFRNYIKGFQMKTLHKDDETDSKGVAVKKGYDLQIPAYMKEVKDKNGTVVGADVRSENVDGMEVADQDVYNAFMTDVPTRLHFDTKFKAWNAGRGDKQLDPKSPEAELKKRELLLGELQQNAVYKFNQKDATRQDTWVGQRDGGYQTAAMLARMLKEKTTEDKLIAKEDATDPAIVYRGMGGDRTVLEGIQPEEIEGEQMYNVTNRIGGLKLGVDEEHKVKYASAVYVDPKNNTMAVTDPEVTTEYPNGKTTVYRGADVRKFWADTAPYNTVGLDKVTKTNNRYMNGAGKYVGKKDDEHMAILDAQNDAIAHDADKNFADRTAEFEGSGSAGDLQHAVGMKLKDGSTVKEADSRGGFKRFFGADRYVITITSADGKEEDKTFDTKEAMAAWLKENRQPKYTKAK